MESIFPIRLEFKGKHHVEKDSTINMANSLDENMMNWLGDLDLELNLKARYRYRKMYRARINKVHI